jgi:monothiol glutaredoxin
MSDEDESISLPIAGGDDAESDDTETTESSDEQPEGVLGAIDREVSKNDVVLYMKGTPQQPMCGFSARAAGLLQSYGVAFEAVNVLQEEDKREGIKEYGDWATIPQLYVDGELIGGSDILVDMHESGELAEVFEDAGVKYKGA